MENVIQIKLNEFMQWKLDSGHLLSTSCDVLLVLYVTFRFFHALRSKLVWLDEFCIDP
jgi:hypothetical protein